ncbi:MAG: 2-oxoacid:ferredoxin oxidoreductase subunit beta [Bacteroidota bacterium]
MAISTSSNGALKAKDFATDQDVRWCPGCGDYSILKQVQSVMAELGLDKDKVAVISGIGCSSRFPYYMDTYGMHSIHGRAPAVVSGLRMANPDLSIWMVTGDGDGLSIGGNHLLHLLRRNFDVNVMLFNNQIYGLTKGQYSPTSEVNKLTKSTPLGSLDYPVNPLAFAIGASGTFIARSMDRDPKHLKAMLHRSQGHRGTSFLEIYQNCNIFNDGAFFSFTDKKTRGATSIYLEQDQPLVYGLEQEWGIRLDGYKPQVVKIGEEFSKEDLWVHDESDLYKAQILTRFFDDPIGREAGEFFPRPFGVLFESPRPTYEEQLFAQVDSAIERKGSGDLDQLLAGNSTWKID